jgi:TRAP-type uncharacterized transport system fused permease subunit
MNELYVKPTTITTTTTTVYVRSSLNVLFYIIIISCHQTVAKERVMLCYLLLSLFILYPISIDRSKEKERTNRYKGANVCVFLAVHLYVHVYIYIYLFTEQMLQHQQ